MCCFTGYNCKANSIIIATAKKYGATIWTQDSDFKNLNNVKYFPKGK
jgi:predicted nucleic acid-binding protein